MTEPAPPPSLAHVGLTVPDLDYGVRWYQEVLGFSLLAGPVEVVIDDSHLGRQARDVFGERIGRFRQAHLYSAEGWAIEMFEFLEPVTTPHEDHFAYWRTGVFHLCLVDPAIEQLVTAIVAGGGRQLTSQVWEIFPDEPYRMAYCTDPFGNVIEIYTHPHGEVFAGRGKSDP